MRISVIGGGPGRLYFAVLAKKEWPQHEITVHERNPAGATFGFGVVFSDETLGIFRDYDQPFHEAIRRNFTYCYWDNVEIHFKGRRFLCAGNGFAGCSHVSLLLLLHGRADLVALARPHLTNPYFTLQASAWYQHEAQFWPNQSGKRQAFRLGQLERDEYIKTRLTLRPPTHEVQEEDDGAGSHEPAGTPAGKPVAARPAEKGESP